MEWTPLSPILFAKLLGGGGGSVTPASIVTATGQMTSAQATETRGNLGAEPEKFVVTVTYDDQTDSYSADKTFAEIVEAYEAGKTVLVFDLTGSLPRTTIYCCISVDPYTVEFRGISPAFSTYNPRPVPTWNHFLPMIGNISVDDTDTWSFTYTTISIEPMVNDEVSSTPTITPSRDNVYNCGTLTSLTITNPPATGSYSIVFTSGSTATTTTIPATILGLEDFAAEANTLYEINVLDNRAVVGSWAVSSGE